MFLCTSAARMSPGLYRQLVQMLSLSFFLARLLPLGLFLLHFNMYFFFVDPIFLCDLLSLFAFISYVCFHANVPVPEHVHTHPSPCSLHSPPPVCPAVGAADKEGQAGG